MKHVNPDSTLLQNATRRLSAIMFTDMVGYTALVQEDERQAKEHRDQHRALLNDAVNRFGGKILQYYGDGTLSTFASAVAGVRCAVWIQQMVREKPSVPLRIGLHLGDIIEEENAVFGDGVNIASRIQSISIPGAVLISGKVYDEIKNHHDLSALRMGEFVLKNVKRPLEIYAVNAEGLKTPGPHDLDGARADTRSSIAVLPFVNMSADSENEYFSDGIAEEIINALTKVANLRVTARTSSFMFNGRNNDIREIGKQLNVHKVLEGSVRKAGDRVRITAQLINT